MSHRHLFLRQLKKLVNAHEQTLVPEDRLTRFLEPVNDRFPLQYSEHLQQPYLSQFEQAG